MKGLVRIVVLLGAVLQSARTPAAVDRLFRPVSSELVNFGASAWNVRFSPLRDVPLNGLGLLFDPAVVNARSSLSLSLWQDEAGSVDDRLAAFTAVAGADFVDSGLAEYVFRFTEYSRFALPRSIVLERSRPYVLIAELDLEGSWPQQFVETQEFPFTTASGNLRVLGGGRNLGVSSDEEHPPLLVQLETQTGQISRWNNDSAGDWSVAGNWNGGVPDGTSTMAVFGGAITQPRHVLLLEPVTVSRIDFNNTHAYTLAGSSALALATTRGQAEINIVKGSHTISAPLALADDTLATVAPVESNLTITALTASDSDLTKEGAGTLTVNNLRAAELTLNRGTVRVAGNPGTAAPGTSVVTALAIAGDSSPTATLDLTDNAIVIDYAGISPADTVRRQIIAGRGGAGLGKGWDGLGITSSAAAMFNTSNPESRSIGYGDNATMPLGPFATFGGQAVDGTSVVIALTRTGDANLDGVVNDDDVTIIGTTYAPGASQPSWALGDFDYNGFVDDDDVTLLGAFYDPSAAPLINPPSEPGANGLAAVPEPASLILLLVGFAGLGLFVRRRT